MSISLDITADREDAEKLINDWAEMRLEDAVTLLSFQFADNDIYNKNAFDNEVIREMFSEIRANAVHCLLM